MNDITRITTHDQTKIASTPPEVDTIGREPSIPKDTLIRDLRKENERLRDELKRLKNLSENESFSFVIMESWITGTPVIVSSQSNVTKSHCEKSKGGFIITNENEFCESVNRLRNKPYLRENMGAFGREYVKENYSWFKIKNNYLRILEKLKLIIESIVTIYA